MHTSTHPKHDPWCQAWLGRKEIVQAILSDTAVASLSATLNRPTPQAGDELPAGWQWLFFNPVVPASALGEDGHPLRTCDSFLPPLALPRRMWAGSRIHYLQPLLVGREAIRTSRIESITPKEGKTGRMCFVTVVHSISSQGKECVVEEQDIVYREASLAPAPVNAMPDEPAAVEAGWQQALRPDAVLLFRYSALTFNGHRIHYDRTYAEQVEHYPDLVVHGPLTATLLQALACEAWPDKRLRTFQFKGLQPLFVNRPLTLCADVDAEGEQRLQLRALAPDGSLAMQASASFSLNP